MLICTVKKRLFLVRMKSTFVLIKSYSKTVAILFQLSPNLQSEIFLLVCFGGTITLNMIIIALSVHVLFFCMQD